MADAAPPAAPDRPSLGQQGLRFERKLFESTFATLDQKEGMGGVQRMRKDAHRPKNLRLSVSLSVCLSRPLSSAFVAKRDPKWAHK